MAGLSPAGRKRLFWVAYILLMALVVYGTLMFLKGEIFDMILWQKLIDDPDHRWKPHEREDINSDGLRSHREAKDYPPEDFNILFSGDSFTFGHLLSAEEAPPEQFEPLARAAYPDQHVNVINFGWSSSSPYLSLRLLKDKAKKYHPKLVIFLLDMTDYKDDYFYQHVIEKIGSYRFIVDHPLLSQLPRQIAEKFDNTTHWQEEWLGYPSYSTYFVAFQPYEKSLPFFERTYNNLVAMNTFVTQQLGAKFVVIIYPRHWQYTDKEAPNSWERHSYVALGPYVLNNYRYFDQKAKEAPFPIISLLEDFKQTKVFPTTLGFDSHWNPAGAKLAADLIFDHCQKEAHCFDSFNKTP